MVTGTKTPFSTRFRPTNVRGVRTGVMRRIARRRSRKRNSELSTDGDEESSMVREWSEATTATHGGEGNGLDRSQDKDARETNREEGSP